MLEKMNEFWSMNEGTFYCLYDEPRTIAFKKAIDNTVKPGDIVVELGAGSGVLSMFAADAGAKKVFAVELDAMNAECLRKTIRLNDYESIIEVVEGDATEVSFPFKADVIICEMIATGLIEELQIPAMQRALAYSHRDTKILLKKYDITADLVFEKNEFYGKKFHVVRYEFPDLDDLVSASMTSKHTVKSVDFRISNEDALLNEKFQVAIKEKGLINGLRISGITTFWDDSTFDSSIAYSFPAVLPIEETSVSVGDIFEIAIMYSMCEGPEKLQYTVLKL
jgi:predicted RNA methylase